MAIVFEYQIFNHPYFIRNFFILQYFRTPFSYFYLILFLFLNTVIKHFNYHRVVILMFFIHFKCKDFIIKTTINEFYLTI